MQRQRDLAAEIKCPECQGLSMGDSDSTTARRRADITARIAHGESDAQIRQAYVDRYGESILLKPEAKGIGLIVWALPVAAFVAATGDWSSPSAVGAASPVCRQPTPTAAWSNRCAA